MATPNKEMGQKLPSYNCRSTGWLAWYEITKESKPWGIFSLLISTAWGTCMDSTACPMLAVSGVTSFKDA